MNHKIPYLQKKVKAIKVNKKSISQLLEEMERTGFQGRKLAEAASVWEKMIKDKNLAIMLGYAGSLSTTGQWKIINWLIENRYIDVLVSTGANISEDIVEAMGYSYWKGHHLVDDEKLLQNYINRYYDVFGLETEQMKMIKIIAQFIVENIEENHPYSSREFLYLFGKFLIKQRINSIVATAAKYKVPVFCPAIVDSSYGDAALIAKSQGFNLILDNMKDYVEFMGLSEKVKDTGVIYIGGGVPKDFIQLFAISPELLYPEGRVPDKIKKIGERESIEDYYPHKYAIQITTDSPQWGGLSGCTFEEAISWGKEGVLDPKVQCFCDATIALPIVTHALQERIKTKRKGVNFPHLFP